VVYRVVSHAEGQPPGAIAVLLMLGPPIAFAIMARAYSTRTQERAIADRPIESRPEEFVSSRACDACHPREYTTWSASYHRSMSQVADPDTIRGAFGDVPLRQGAWTFHLERTGGASWVDMPELDWSRQGPSAPRVRREIVLATGSHNMQAYWYASGNS